MSLAATLGVRDFWGIYDKRADLKELRQIIVDFRDRIGCGDQVAIMVDRSLLEDFNTDFASLDWDKIDGLTNPQAQFCRGRSPACEAAWHATDQEASLNQAGKRAKSHGRRGMRIEFRAPAGDYPEEIKESGSIVKIGRSEKIETEVKNYATILPSLFGNVFYPSIEATGVCGAARGCRLYLSFGWREGRTHAARCLV